MKGIVKIRARPRLNSPNMVAAWPGIGNVSMIAANYLLKNLDFKELGEIEASYFFDPIGVIVRDSVVEEPQFPQSKFYYWKNKRPASDLILFIGDNQPVSKGYELANLVLDVAERFLVNRIYTGAAAMTRMHHTELPRVWGVATTPSVVANLKKYNLAEKGNFQIAGLNGLLLGAARERGIEAACLLGEVPSYASRIQNPMAALAVIKVLTGILNINIDTAELAQLADETTERMREVAAEAMEQYIDQFTMPIWEHDKETGEYEEDDEE